MKRILSMILALALVIACLPVFQLEVHAVTTVASGTCGAEGSNVTWSLDDTGTLTISGTGDMGDVYDHPWFDYGTIKSVIIENGVTGIAESAFTNHDQLTSVTIPASVTSIGRDAFLCGSSLTEIKVDAKNPNFSSDANGVLYNKDKTTLIMHPNVTDTECVIPDSVTSIGEFAFYNYFNVTSVKIGNSVTSIGSSAFSGCSLTSVKLGKSVTSIGKGAFEGCRFLTAVTIPDSVTSIGEYAFSSCDSLTSVTIPASVIDLAPTAFSSCYRLTEIKIDNKNPHYSSDTNGVFDKEKKTLLIFPAGKTSDYVVPDYVTSIGDSAFYGCYGLNSVVIPDSVTSIGDNAFYYCSGLTNVTIGNSVTRIGDFAFDYCGLTSLTIPNSVTSIGIWAFSNCSKLTSVTIGNSAASIGRGAFAHCRNLREITFKGSAPSISEVAFWNVNATAYYPADDATWTEAVRQNYGGTLTWIPYQTGPAIVASGKCGANLTWKLTEDGVLTISGTGDMDNYTDNTMPWYDYKNSVKSVVIENGVTSIGDCAFKDFGSLTDVAIGETVTGIGDYAFDCCDLASLTIPNSVTSIGIYAFRHCKRLASLNFPNSVTSIGAYAFCYCTGLTEVTFGKSVTFIDDGAFYECTNLNKITFKGSAPTIGSSIMAGLTFSGVRATAYYYPDETWTEDVMQVCGSLITWVAMEMPKLSLGGEEFADQDTVWIEGLPYPIQSEGNDRYVELPTEDDCYMVTYTYHTGDANDVHTQYPTGMKVYKVSDGQITHIPQLDNLLQYSGASIRITGKKGIRMITSLTKTNKTALTGKGLAGFKLLEYGTALCFAHEIPQGDALVLGRDFTRSNYAYKKGVADPVFASTKDLIQYTNVLVGFSLDQCKDDIAMRPYIILEDAAGNQITLYGGTIYRSIGYIAYQNRTVFKPKTASYNYVWEIIHHVYDDKYDADYKG